MPEGLIAGLYQADPTRPLAGFDGAAAFGARGPDQGAAFVAIEVPAGVAPRALALTAFGNGAITGVMAPLAHGAARLPGRKAAYYVVTAGSPGPSLAEQPRAWPEEKLLALVLRPVAAALERLASRGVTHRAIRPDNLFQAAPDQPVMLGPAWVAPPASRQPALYEPPYVAQCDAAGRGDGSIADDVYALGVVLVVLALGREPLTGEAPAEIVRRKLELGSFAAIAAEERLPGEVGAIVRAMLAEDPLQRPAPAELLDPLFGRARRALPRTPRRAPEPLVIGAAEVFVPRALAYALREAPQQGLRLLKLGVVDRWLRRSLGDAQLAQALEQAVERRTRDAVEGEARADALLLMRATAVLDPLAPPVWQGVVFWPDGLGCMLAAGDGQPALAEMIDSEAIAAWAACRSGRESPAAFALEARRLRAVGGRGGIGGGLKRLGYALNPLLACRSPLLGAAVAVTLSALLTALDAATGAAERRGGVPPIDAEIAAFILARGASGVEADLARLSSAATDAEKALATLRIFANLQRSIGAGPLPGLARWLVETAGPLLGRWKERSRRKELEERVAANAERGDLGRMLALLGDAAARARDAAGLQAAERSLKRIDDELKGIAASAAARAGKARQLGQEIAAGAGLAVLALTLAMMAFG
ncbi:MAG: hypothetical protein ACREFP_08630 [Acetobacteraceae bacterium]